MDSRFQRQQYQHHFQDQFHHHQKPPPTNNLTRFRSAPSSYFATFLDVADSLTTKAGGGGGGGVDRERQDFSNARPLSPETEDIFANFMSSMGAEPNPNSNSSVSSQKLCDIPENSPVNQDSEFMVEVKQERETLPQQQGSFVTSPQPVVYQSQSKPPLANQRSSMKSSARAATSLGVTSMSTQMKIKNKNDNNSSSGLTRHSSSPAGFFANILNILDNGFGEMKGIGNFPTGQTQAQAQAQAQRQPSATSGLMRQNSLDSIMSENLSSLDDDQKKFSELDASENQSGERMNRPQRLAHHLSLPKTLTDLSDMEKLLFEDTVVPCRIRAKRGCATHPRSIAERVRRTKISERMRKLQDLVPNMDKQTNTADMLDLAVEYIKDLQKQVKILTDYRAKCTCLRYTQC